MSSSSFKARVLHDYEPIETKEIPLVAGTIINVVRTHESGWWKGEWNGKLGWFPSSYVSSVGEAEKEEEVGKQAGTLGKIANALSRFFSRRVTMSELEKRNLIANKGTKVFAVPIQEVADRDGADLPIFVSRAFDFLWEHALGTEGLFRIPASLAELRRVREQIDYNEQEVTFTNPAEVNLVGGLLKLFIREHPEPFFPRDQYQRLLSIQGIVDDDERLEVVVAALKACNVASRCLILQLLALLHECATNHVDTMMMKSGAYATVFGPQFIVEDVNEAGMNLADMGKQVTAFTFMVDFWPKIFPLLDGVNADGTMVKTTRSAEPADNALGRCVATYAYDARVAGKELSFAQGTKLIITRKAANGWWKGYVEGNAAESGWFPEGFVSEI